MRKLVLLVSFAVASTLASAQAEMAETAVKKHLDIAQSQEKTLFLSFHASWCGWCHKLEDFLKSPKIAPVWNKHFVTLWLTVDEDEQHAKDVNPGGDELRNKLGGKDQGIPFFAFLDAEGKAIVSSARKTDSGPQNIGHPVAPEEIGWFMEMLKKARPQMSESDRAIIEKALKEQKSG